ncbi:MAG: hypothetical protein ABI175_17420, partial [Polyangiales bacterium]
LVVTATGTIDGGGRAQGAEVAATLENKGTAPLKAHVLTLRKKREGRDELELRAEGTVSMRALGLPEIKGPLAAFVVKDDVRFDVTITIG